MTSIEEIAGWLKEGKKEGATHTIIICDTFDWEDYPVHVMPEENVRTVELKHNQESMQRVMEVYSHKSDHKAQLKERRAFHYE